MVQLLTRNTVFNGIFSILCDSILACFTVLISDLSHIFQNSNSRLQEHHVQTLLIIIYNHFEKRKKKEYLLRKASLIRSHVIRD